LILTHRGPDGDTIGSAAALCRALRSLGKASYLFPNCDITEKLRPFCDGLLAPEGFAPALVCAVDIADSKLFTKDAAVFADVCDLCIDHHPSNKLYAGATLLDGKASAVAEIIYDLVCEMNVPLTAEIALPLFLALSTDTGCFRYPATTPKTMRIGAELMETGIDFYSINRDFLETKSRARFALEQTIMAKCEFSHAGRVALVVLTEADMAAAAATEEDTSNLSQLLRCIEGVDLGVILRERDGLWRVSMRSLLPIASVVCAHMGGGGHARAAGATLNMTMDEAVSALKAAISAEMCNE